MSPKVAAAVAQLSDMTVSQLAERYEQVFCEECRSRNKQYLVRRIAWRLQANDEGGLSAESIRKANELAVDAEARVTAPREHPNVRVVTREPNAFVDWDQRLPPPGNHIERQYIDARVSESWSEEKVIQRLQQIANTNPSRDIHKIDSNLACAAARRFGSVKKAMEAARVTSKPRKPR